MLTVPDVFDGKVTAVVTGSDDVGPVPGSVVIVPPRGTSCWTLEGGAAPARGVVALDGPELIEAPSSFFAFTVNV
jgi:hypothetical protein